MSLYKCVWDWLYAKVMSHIYKDMAGKEETMESPTGEWNYMRKILHCGRFRYDWSFGVIGVILGYQSALLLKPVTYYLGCCIHEPSIKYGDGPLI